MWSRVETAFVIYLAEKCVGAISRRPHCAQIGSAVDDDENVACGGKAERYGFFYINAAHKSYRAFGEGDKTSEGGSASACADTNFHV